MKNLGKIILTITITLSLTGYALGTGLFSPASHSPGTDETPDCTLLKVGAKDVPDVIQICAIKGCVERCKCEGRVQRPRIAVAQLIAYLHLT